MTVRAYTSDCHAAFARIRIIGAQVEQDPADQPWRARTAIVLGPDGSRLIIGVRALRP
jgi:hypothetical protein